MRRPRSVASPRSEEDGSHARAADLPRRGGTRTRRLRHTRRGTSTPLRLRLLLHDPRVRRGHRQGDRRPARHLERQGARAGGGGGGLGGARGVAKSARRAAEREAMLERGGARDGERASERASERGRRTRAEDEGGAARRGVRGVQHGVVVASLRSLPLRGRRARAECGAGGPERAETRMTYHDIS